MLTEKLKSNTTITTEEIGKMSELVSNVQKNVIKNSNEVSGFIRAQTSAVENTVGSFGDILESIENIAPLMDKTYKDMDEIVKSKEIVLERVETISAVVEENTAATEETAASSQ